MKYEVKREMMLRVWYETVQYYSDPKRRGIGADGGCRYHIDEWSGEPAKMCAVGRCMHDPARVTRDYPYAIVGIHDELEEQFDNLFKVEYKGLPIEFWMELQNWHDNCSNWDKGGLTPVGEARASMLKLKIETGGFA